MNLVILKGRLGQDPEVKQSQSGLAIAKFSLATNERVKGEDQTEWHRCVSFGKTAEVMGEHLSKGREILVQGKIKTNSWEDQDGNRKYMTEILVDRFEFCGAPKDNGGQPQKASSRTQTENDDIPF